MNPNSLTTAQACALWSVWRARITAITEDVADLVLMDSVFRMSMRLIQDWPDSRRNFVYGWVVATYSRDSSIRIRRLLDPDKSAESLLAMLNAISQHPEIISIERFASEYRPDMRDVGRADFRAIIGLDSPSLTQEQIANDKGALISRWEASGMKEQTKWRIAHNIPSKVPSALPRWQDAHDCVSAIERCCLRYRYLLLQIDNASVLPCNMEDVEAAVAHFWNGAELSHPGMLLESLQAPTPPGS